MVRTKNLLTALKYSLVAIGLGWSCFVQAQADTAVICKLDKQVRVLRIQKNPENKNVLLYRKYSRDQELGQFQFLKSAIQVMKEVQQNLEKSDWVCREVPQTKVSDTTIEG